MIVYVYILLSRGGADTFHADCRCDTHTYAIDFRVLAPAPSTNASGDQSLVAPRHRSRCRGTTLAQCSKKTTAHLLWRCGTRVDMSLQLFPRRNHEWSLCMGDKLDGVNVMDKIMISNKRFSCHTIPTHPYIRKSASRSHA